MSRPGVGENHTANWRNYAKELEAELAALREAAQDLHDNLLGTNCLVDAVYSAGRLLQQAGSPATRGGEVDE